MIPCTACEKRGLRCVKHEGSLRCSDCVRRGLSRCDVGGPAPGDWVSLDQAKEKLDLEEEAAEAEHERLVMQSLAKIKRIRIQKKFLRDREKEMMRRGLASLDELDAAEEKERGEEERRDSFAASSAAANEPSYPMDEFLDPALAEALVAYDPSDPFWSEFVPPGSSPGVPDPSLVSASGVGGTPEAPRGNG